MEPGSRGADLSQTLPCLQGVGTLKEGLQMASVQALCTCFLPLLGEPPVLVLGEFIRSL